MQKLQLNRHLIVKSRKAVVVAEVSDNRIIRVYCKKSERCKEAGVIAGGCPPYCEFIVAIRQHLRKQPSKFLIMEL
jgi:hypothetical protein